MTALHQINTDIPQGFSVLFIFFLFFNAELFDTIETQGVKMFTVNFVNDINLLAYSKSTEKNCKTLTVTHNICM